MVDGHSALGAFARIAVPIAAPGMVAAFILVVDFVFPGRKVPALIVR